MSYALAFIGMPGPMEMCIIGFVMLLLFGNRLPGAMRSLGSSLTSFKKGMQEIEEIPRDIEKTINDTGEGPQ